MTICPACGDAFERIASHWSNSGCGYPEISTEQRDILDGLMLAGATVAGNGKNRHITIGTTSEQLAAWTAEQLDWLTHSVREEQPDGAAESVYRIRTTSHPQCNRYERWSKIKGNSGREPPEDIVLERTTARVWWAFAGGLEWSGPYDSQCNAAFSAERDERANWIYRVLTESGYEPTRAGKRVQLPPTDTRRWLNWVGNAAPGVEHKWQTSKAVYKTLRTEPETESEYRTALYTAALKIARERTKKELSEDVFETRVDGIQATDIAEWLGGGDWHDALRVASVQAKAGDSHKDGDPQQERSNYTKKEIIEAIRTVDERIGDQLLSKRTYDEHRDDNQPAGNTITNRFRWTEIKADAGVATQPRADDLTESAALDALREVDDRVDGPLTMDRYDNACDDDHPNSRSIAVRFGWNDSKAKAGLAVDNRGSWERENE